MIGRNGKEEKRMMSMISKYASTLGDNLKTENFVLRKIPPYAKPSIRELQIHSHFWMSDHARFWWYKEEKEFMSFPSILLSDTGTYTMSLSQYHTFT